MENVIKKDMENIIKWVKNFGFEYKIIDNIIFWRTNYQTVKLDLTTNTMIYLNWKAFEEI